MRIEARSVALAVAAIACASAAAVAVACIVVPPTDVTLMDEPPRIVSVLPANSPPLPNWPEGGFVVGVDPEWPENPTAPPAYYVFIDPTIPLSSPVPNLAPGTPPNAAGVSLISFSIASQNLGLDDNACHTVLLLVARHFNPDYVADPPGNASVTWTYAGPNAPYGCIGSPLDGQPPPPDAADGPFIPPSEAGGPDL